MSRRRRQRPSQPRPQIPGLDRRAVRLHAERLFRDVVNKRALTPGEWRLAEQDLARKLENDGL